MTVQTLQRYANYEVPLKRKHLVEVARYLIGSFSTERRFKLPFRGESPGLRSIRSFEKRHKSRVTLGHPTKQEEKRYAATSGETITHHFCYIETNNKFLQLGSPAHLGLR